MALSFSCNASLTPHLQDKLTQSDKKCLEKVKTLVKTRGVSSIKTSPHESLQNGTWVKLICGASFEDVVDIRNLSLVYTLAGVDCIDCAADGSVVNAVNEGIEAAGAILPLPRPWVMISVNDHEDLHFRKAQFDPDDCPLDCSRPCENVCPANAISLASTLHASERGVVTERFYGCGRCFPVCPYDKIREITYVRDAAATAELLKREDVDAVEIHTSGRQTAFFKELWDGLGDSLDGRPMSGDIGRGTTREAIAFAVRLAAAEDKPHGFLQLAGGTNAHTIDGLKKQRLFQTTTLSSSASLENSKDEKLPSNSLSSPHALIGGVAYGGYARKIVGRILNSMKELYGHASIEDYPEHLSMALIAALDLVGPMKCYRSS